VSPRRRARRTLELFGLGLQSELPWSDTTSTMEASTGTPTPMADSLGRHKCEALITVTADIAEWNYGDYEGLTSAQIREQRQAKGQKLPWDIWTDGCPGGESPEDVSRRLDKIIAEIREKWQAEAFLEKEQNGDVLFVAHGHILRALAMRWIGNSLSQGPSMLLEAGGLGTLSYEHNSIKEPAIMLGSAFVVDDTSI
jgi:broad specificity phosphatase PhoE